jgi:FkbM family methyltransferase
MSLVEKLRLIADRNRPSRKPQLWENLGLALRRRVEFEVAQRLDDGWLDRARVTSLSEVGFADGGGPLRMEIVARDVMSKALFLYGTSEIAETRLFQALLRPGMTLIDVGANIGYYTLLGARAVGPSGSVYAFEPNAGVRSRLVTNVGLNGFRNVTVRDEAVTRSSGKVRFYVSMWNENSGISSILPGEGRGATGEEVSAVSLDDFVASIGGRHVDLLKIDVEGAEPEVFAGGQRVLGAADAPALLFEAFELEPLLGPLRDLGYSVRRLHYKLAGGLELLEPGAAFDDIFAAYEPPNYFAVKDPSIFDSVTADVNARRSGALQWLGRL